MLELSHLRVLQAVVAEGSFQAGARRLHRTHPTVITSIKNLEAELGFALFDRTGYRAKLTERGQEFLRQAQGLLAHADALQARSEMLAAGAETELDVVVGDLCPLPETLRLLRQFGRDNPNTQLNLHFEALGGPTERLAAAEAHIIVHHVPRGDMRFDYSGLFTIELVPVVAPNFLESPPHSELTAEDMAVYVQCVIRDTSTRTPRLDHFLVPGASRITVADQFMKREVILQGLGWGHLPKHLIEQDLDDGRLLSIEGSTFARSRVALGALRRRGVPQGPVAERLWQYLTEHSDTE